MQSGRGISADKFSTAREGAGRVRVTGNEVRVQKVDRMGNLLATAAPVVTPAPGAPVPAPAAPIPTMENAWGTVVYVHF